MKKSFEFEDEKLYALLLLAMIVGIGLTIAADQQILLSLLTIIHEDGFPRQGIILFDMDNESCRYYGINQYLPVGREGLLQSNSETCASPWIAALKMEKLERINQSTNNSEINELLINATRHMDDRDWKAVNETLNRLNVERKYSVEN